MVGISILSSTAGVGPCCYNSPASASASSDDIANVERLLGEQQKKLDHIKHQMASEQ